MAEREARPGDTLIVDFSIKDKSSGEVLNGLEGKKFELDSGNPDGFIPGVVDEIFGMRVGEQRCIDFVFPSNWEPSELASVAASVRHPPVLYHQPCLGFGVAR